ncbi:MAG TPA: type 1 glutamine amidotransferase [Terriglobales bacterium]|nr:type 1 glutamine amidotransferase [Terriglobales bacterium]
MWSIIQHMPWEGPGLIAEEMTALGIEHQICRMDLNAPLPAADKIEGLVVMGGTMGVYEAAEHPFLKAEMALLSATVTRGTPTLAICLGAQLLAGALGARVAPGPVWEVGAGEVELTPEGQRDAMLGGAGTTMPVVHWHHDTFGLPDGATLLASTDVYPQQAFRVGLRAYGLQFHCEVNTALASGWADHGLALDPALVVAMEAAGRRAVRNFLELA